MFKMRYSLFLCLSICVLNALCDTSSPSNPTEPLSPAAPPTDVPTAAPTQATSDPPTAASTAEPSTGATSTAAPTTAKPTTAAPTTAKPSTAAPTTKGPTSPPSTTVPSTQGPPTIQKFVITDGKNNKTVLMLNMAARFCNNVTGGEVEFNLPDNAVATGDERSVEIKFDGPATFDLGAKAPAMTLKMDFAETKDKDWSLGNVTLTYPDAEGKPKTVPKMGDENGVGEIHAHEGNSFSCKSDTEMTFDDVIVNITNIHVQPFLDEKAAKFGTAQMCKADREPNNVVPIAVGAALAALVVVVLVMYLIGRRKHQKGYQTV